jgi:hypothetical protein
MTCGGYTRGSSGNVSELGQIGQNFGAQSGKSYQIMFIKECFRSLRRDELTIHIWGLMEEPLSMCIGSISTLVY